MILAARPPSSHRGKGYCRYEGLLSSIVSRPPFVAGQHPATAVAERNLPVRVLGYQGPVQPKSNVEPLLFRRRCIRVHFRARPQ
jgi:hypothetical protein